MKAIIMVLKFSLLFLNVHSTGAKCSFLPRLAGEKKKKMEQNVEDN